MSDSDSTKMGARALRAAVVLPWPKESLLEQLARAGFEAWLVSADAIDAELSALAGAIVLVHATVARGVCERARGLGRDEPIVALYARFDDEEKRILLQAGADGYESLDACPETLAAVCGRVASRAARARPPDRAVVGMIQIDRRQRRVTVGGSVMNLAKYPYELLDALAERPGETLTYAELRKRWGSAAAAGTNIEAVTVRALRSALGPEAAGQIETVNGVGFRLRATRPSVPAPSRRRSRTHSGTFRSGPPEPEASRRSGTSDESGAGCNVAEIAGYASRR